jgi:hypothetical protein
MDAVIISLIHATRWRPTQALQARASWLQKAKFPQRVEHWFAFDEDDEVSGQALGGYPHVRVNPGGSSVAAWNAGDDGEPQEHWDKLIVSCLGDLQKPKVLAISDGHRKDPLLCMAILNRARYVQQGWMFAPDYISLWSDNEFTFRAYQDAVVMEARDVVFHHHHPVHDATIPVDATYQHGNRREANEKGKQIYLQRNPGGEHFLASIDVPGQEPETRMKLLQERMKLRRVQG